MAYKQNPGRGPMMKTGRDIPLNMKSPAYMTDGPGDKKEKSEKKEDHLPGYQPLDKKHYFSNNKDAASQIANTLNKAAYKKDSVQHRKNDLRLNKIKPGYKVPGTKLIVNDFNSDTNSFEVRKKGTLKLYSISRRDMVKKTDPKSGRNYVMHPKKIETFKRFRSGTNDGV